MCAKQPFDQAHTGQILRFLIPATALLMLLLSQWLVSGQEQAVFGMILALPAAAILVATLHTGKLGPDLSSHSKRPALEQPLVQARTWRLVFAGASLLLAIRAFAGFRGNNLADGFWFWIGALAYFYLAVATASVKRQRRVPDRLGLAVVAVTVLGFIFRFYHLDALPPEMTSDHAEKLLDVHDVLNGWRPIFFPRNTGREMFQFYLTAAIVRLTGLPEGFLALKIGTALFGAVTVPATYFLGRELFGNLVGIYAAYFLAISHWHVAISRIGLRFPLTAVFATPALYFLLRAFRTNRRNDWLAAGLLLGLGLHGYTATRIVPFLFVLLVLLKFGADGFARRRGQPVDGPRGYSSQFWLNAVLAASASFLAFLPLLRFMLEEPQLAWYRSVTRVGDVTRLGSVFWSNVKNVLLMFNYRGDVVPANTIPEAPQLGTVTGALFFTGILCVLWRLFVYRERRSAYTLVGFAALLLPSILSLAFPEENPSAVRASGAAPLAMIIAAVPLASLTTMWWRDWRTRSLATTLFAVLLLFSAVENADWYFNRYREHTLQSSWNASEMGTIARQFAEETGSLDDVYHIPFPHWVDTRNIGINAGDVTWENAVLDLKHIAGHAENPVPKLYFVFPADTGALRYLRSVYPEGRLEMYDSARPGKDFLVFRVGN
jgi:hypothetical protein